MIAIRLTRERVDAKHLYKGKSGTYLDMVLIENKDGVDQYGNSGFVAQSVSKEAKERGEKGPIIGNWKVLTPKGVAPKPSTQPVDDNPPF